jgi:hypothetical protein
MEHDREKTKKMYWQDTGLVLTFLVFSWWVLGYVLMNVSRLAIYPEISDVAIAAGSIALIFVTSSLIAVLIHLRRNKDAVYHEELQHCTLQLEKKGRNNDGQKSSK